MDSAIPLLVAFVGTAFGAYFAVIKTRRERLWSDRYEALRDIVLNLEIIESYFDSETMDNLGLTVITGEEKNNLKTEWPVARHELRRNIAKTRLLFKEKQIRKIIDGHQELNNAFFDLYNDTSDNEFSDGCNAVAKKANQTIEETINVAQNNLLPLTSPTWTTALSRLRQLIGRMRKRHS